MCTISVILFRLSLFFTLCESTLNKSEKGTRSLTRFTKIVGGTPEESPYVAALLLHGDQICGCTILNEECVLTAAHCITEERRYYYSVVTGAYDIVNWQSNIYAKRHVVTKITVHEKYKSVEEGYDVAVICLHNDTRIEFNDYAKKIHLANSTHEEDCEAGNVWGWGATSDGGYSSDLLQTVRVHLITTSKCNYLYNRAGYNIYTDQICAGEENGGKDGCSGDSGGPLICSGYNSLKRQIGIVSFGIGCADYRYPGVYTRISSHYNWIVANSKMKYTKNSE